MDTFFPVQTLDGVCTSTLMLAKWPRYVNAILFYERYSRSKQPPKIVRKAHISLAQPATYIGAKSMWKSQGITHSGTWQLSHPFRNELISSTPRCFLLSFAHPGAYEFNVRNCLYFFELLNFPPGGVVTQSPKLKQFT